MCRLLAVGRVALTLLSALLLSALPALADEAVPLTIWSAPAFWTPPSSDGLPPAGTRQALALPSSPLPFVAVTPCRQFDSRSGTPLLDNTPRTLTLTGTPCGIPANAQAASVNITVFNITGAGSNGVFKVGTVSPPPTAWINYPKTETQRANAGVVALTGTGAIVVQVNQGAGSVDLVVDVNGYYGALTEAQAVAANPLQIALLRWYPANQSGATFSVGSGPICAAFDGANIWVVNQSSSNVTKLRAGDGAWQGTYDVGTSPRGAAFDGAFVWVANNGDGNVTRLRASDGANYGSFDVGTSPVGVAFDGANIWVANFGSNDVTKLRASDGATLGTFGAGTHPLGVAFDGVNIWVANEVGVRKLRVSDGANLGTVSAGSYPQSVAFDGANVWVTNYGSANVTKIRASDGANLGTFNVGSNPQGVVFDGANIWAATGGGVTKLRSSDGANLGTFSAGQGPGVAFDGANVWVTNWGSQSVTKL